MQPKFSFNESEDFELPNLNLLNHNIKQQPRNSNPDLLKQNAKLLENVIKEFDQWMDKLITKNGTTKI